MYKNQTNFINAINDEGWYHWAFRWHVIRYATALFVMHFSSHFWHTIHCKLVLALIVKINTTKTAPESRCTETESGMQTYPYVNTCIIVNINGSNASLSFILLFRAISATFRPKNYSTGKFMFAWFEVEKHVWTKAINGFMPLLFNWEWLFFFNRKYFCAWCRYRKFRFPVILFSFGDNRLELIVLHWICNGFDCWRCFNRPIILRKRYFRCSDNFLWHIFFEFSRIF